MRTIVNKNKQRTRGVSIVFFILVMVLVWSIAAMAFYVTSNSTLQHRRNDMLAATEYADGGAVIACRELELAFTNNIAGTTFFSRLTTNAAGAYSLVSVTNASSLVYQRTITTPFTNQSVTAQISVSNTPLPQTAKVIAMATVNKATVTNTVNLQMPFAFGAAIISVNAGTSDTSVSKTSAQNDGNVVINGSGQGPMVVNGGKGLAVLANGRVNVSATNDATVIAGVSMTNESTANQLPDYTGQGNANTLFDIGRFIAVADLTPNGPSTRTNNHFTNIATFVAAVNLHLPTNPIEGVVVLDVAQSDNGNLNASSLPNGVNIRGMLLFNFVGSGWNATSTKIVSDAAFNINPADLSHVVATNVSTYTTGYPPVYSDPTKNPDNINITSKGYANFTSADDLPAFVYSIGVVDLHGPLDISGVMYTPSYMEIENKTTGATQYINGAVIMGSGIYLEDTSKSTTIVTYDPNAVNALATSNNVGRKVFASYWQ